MRSGFISRSVRARLQVSDAGRFVPLVNIQTHTHRQTNSILTSL